jgi:hypothetical protein
MAAALRQPRQQVFVIGMAVLALAALLATPVLAAPERGLLCDDSADSAPAVSPRALTATPVNNSDELLERHLLRPRTEAALRGAFASKAPGDDSEIDMAEAEASDAAPPDPAARSNSERERPAFKRQMYRRDI